MAKFVGALGFVTLSETSPGVFTPEAVEKDYVGNLERLSSKWEQTNNINESVKLQQRISVILSEEDSKAITDLRYIIWKGVKWNIATLEIASPRVLLTLGGVYNENQITIP